MINKGIIAINKPKDWSSFDVVNKIKHMVKPLKVGHLGTLDPMATGVLLVTIGKATKLFDIMQAKQKTYVATFKFGLETDTLDSTGNEINKSDNIPNIEEIQSVLSNFIGEIDQIPPKYSAKSINGVRAYDLARQGVDFEIKPKTVKIDSIDILSYDSAELKLKIVCGSGTYIRSIGRDIAYKLNTFATMTSLVRTKISNFDIDNCYEMFNIEKDNIFETLVPIESVLDYPILNLNENDIFKLLNGQIVKIQENDGNYLLKDKQNIVAIIKISDFNAKMIIFLG